MPKNSDAYDLRWARENQGYNQQFVADLIGAHRVTISEWETGKRPVPKRKLARILELLEVNRDEIPPQPVKPLTHPAKTGEPVREIAPRMLEIKALIARVRKDSRRESFMRQWNEIAYPGPNGPPKNPNPEGLYWNVQSGLIHNEIHDAEVWPAFYATGIPRETYYSANQAENQFRQTIAWWEANRPPLI